MAAELKVLVEDLAKVRGQIGVAKTRLLKAEWRERELLQQILEMAIAENDEMESLWDRHQAGMSGDFKLALVIGQDVAVVKIEDEYFERSQADRYRAVDVAFIPLAQPLNESAPDAANIQGLN